jgi:parallel beta-helix repeat protein
VNNAVLVGLDVENSALGIRVNHGQDAVVDQCAVLGTRVEQGILVASSPGAIIMSSVISDTAREGILVVTSPGVVLDHDQVTNSRNADGIGVGGSPGATVEACTASDSYHDGIRVTNSAGLVLSDNTAADNLNIGLSITNSSPFQSVADVTASGNSASGNRQADIVVAGSPCGPSGCGTTSTTRSEVTTTTSSTTTSPTTTSPSTSSTTTSSLPGTESRWRFYVQIALLSGKVLNVNVPRRSGDAPIEAAIPADVIPAFPIGGQTSGTEVAALGGDTLQRLSSATQTYMFSHPLDYPNLAGLVDLRWAMRVPP